MIYVDPEELRAFHQARQWWDGAREAIRCNNAPDLIALSRDEHASQLSFALHDHGHALRDVIRYDLAADASTLGYVTKLRELAAGDPEDGQTGAAQAALDLMPASELHKAAVAGEILATVAAAYDQADDMLALTSSDEDIEPQMPTFRVAHRMMSDAGVRQRLGVHGAIRGKLPKADGSSRSAPAIPEDDAEGNPPALDAKGASNQPPTRRRRPKRLLKPQTKKRGR